MKILTDETAKQLEAVIDKNARESGFVDTKTHTVADRRGLWLKVISSEPSPWDAGQAVYTVDVYVTPFDASPLHEDALMFNSAEIGGASASIANDTFVKAVDFLNKEDEWYFVVSAPGSSLSVGQYPYMVYMTGANNAGVFDFVRAHAAL